MAFVRLIILGVLFPALTAVMSGQQATVPASRLLISDLHADTSLPYSIIPIRITDNGSFTGVDTFGVHLAAGYCIDGELEPWLVEKQLPPQPPAGVFDHRFTEHRSGSACLLNGLAVHLQEPGKLDTFKLEFHPGEGGYPMRLSWKDAVAQIAADWESLVLRDGFGGSVVNVNMKVDTAVVITNTFVSTVYIIGRSVPLGTRYLVNATAGAGGTVEPGGTVFIDSGGSRSFTIAPSPGYVIDAVLVDGVNIGPAGEYTFANVTADHTIHATFRLVQYQVDASAGTGGSISPGGIVLVDSGGSRSFTITPSPGYAVDAVLVDGVDIGAVSAHTFTNVTANHTIRAIFRLFRFQIDASAGTGGTISPAGIVLVNSGGSLSFTIAPSAGYSISGVFVDGVNIGAVGGYTFTNVTADHTIRATFAIVTVRQFQIGASAGAGGTISPAGTVFVDSLGSRSFTITPAPGFAIAGVLVDSVNIGPVAGYTFTSVTANHTIRATFAASQYQIVATAGTGGTISPGGTVQVGSGGSSSFTITPSVGYAIDGVLVDGVDIGQVAGYTFTNVTANHTIHAIFRLFQFQIDASAGTGGVISPSGLVRVPAGGNKTFLVQASLGYETDDVIVDGVSQGPLAQYTFTNIAADHSISARFTAAAGGTGIVQISGRDAGTGGNIGTFGVHANATYCLDGEVAPGLVERELPPKPPAGVFDLRFTEHRSGSSCLGPGTRIHLQEPAKLDTFRVEIQPGTGGYPITLDWPPGLASAWTSLTIRDIFGGSLVNASMLTQTSLVLTNPIINALFIVGQSGSLGQTYSIGASAGPGGTIIPQGIVTVDSGSDQSFIAIPNPGFVVGRMTVDGVTLTDTSSYTFLDIDANHSIRVDFHPVAQSGYRTFTAADLAVRAPVKKKALFYGFSFRLVNYSLQAATGLRIDFAGSASTAVEIEGSGPFLSATTPDGKQWNFADGTVAPGDTIIISGNNLRRPASIHRWNWIYTGLNGESQGRFTPAGQRTAYPMPNPANIRDELFRGGFGPDGLTVGVPRSDSAIYYGWVRMDRSAQLQRSLVQRDRAHAAAARCFDFVRQKRALTPMDQDNLMFANLAALKFNLRMSLLGVTPAGLRSLVFQDTVPNPIDGLTLGHIAEYADSLLSGYYLGSVHLCESGTLLEQVDGAIERINAAFAGPMDTLAYASGTVLAAVRDVDQVLFLHENPVIDNMVIDWDRSGEPVPPPPELMLAGNYPNPFNPRTTIRFSLPADAVVSAVVYNQLGQQIAVLHDNEYLTEGEQETDFDGSALGSGLYFCRLSIRPMADPDEDSGSEPETETAVIRMLLLK